MIAVSIIAPINHLGYLCAQQPPTLHYLAAQRVLDNLHYREFYLEQSRAGAKLIVDNGVFDTGTAMSADDIVRAARAVEAHEVVLPDVIGEAEETMRLSAAALHQIKTLDPSLDVCAVIQGATNKDWLECYRFFYSNSAIDSIALPAPLRPQPGTLWGDREFATEYLEKHHLVTEAKTYRLLGLGASGHFELAAQRKHTWVKSVDCALPVILGALGLAIDKVQYIKPTLRVDDIDRMSDESLDIAKHNISTIRAVAGCTISMYAPAL